MPDALIEEIRDNRRFAEAEWDAIRKEAAKDKLCVAGKPWEALDPAAVTERKSTKRPMLASDEIGQYLNQTVNDVRANPRGIKFAPTGNGANDQGAEFYQNHTREIEYRSNAKVSYANAFDNAVTSSVGWVRVNTKRDHVRTFNQNLWIEPVMNPDQVLPDPNGVWPDSRDIRFLFYIEPWSKAEFKRAFPKAKIRDFSDQWQKVAPEWLSAQSIQVAEYWTLEDYTRQLVAFRPKGSAEGSEQMALLDELPDGKLPEGMDNVRQEGVTDTKVCFYRTNGLEVLDEQPWRGKYIPFVSCYGKILYVDEGSGSKRQILSMTRLARSPYMLSCYLETCLAEAVSGVPRSNWVGYKGQFAKPERWQKANREPVAFLESEITVPGNPTPEPLPLPQRQPWDPPIQNLIAAKEMARQAIQAAMGINPLPTDAQRRNDVSGVAQQRRDSAGQRGSFHFVDHHDLMIERVGMILEDLMDKTLDTARDVPVRLPDDSAKLVRINDPRVEDPIFTKGDYRVTISVGPATESQRTEAADFVDTMVQNLGEIAQISGPQVASQVLAKSIKLKQLGPIGDEIADLLEPPQPMGSDGKPLPPEVQQLMQQNQQLQQKVQELSGVIQTKQVEQQGKLQIESMKTEATSADKAADREVKLAIAELAARQERLELFLTESGLVGARAHAAHEAEKQRLHEAGQGALERHAASVEGAKDRLHDLVAAGQSHAHTLAQGQQAADLAPEPPTATPNGTGA